jgi:hypothetical protein
MPAPASLPCSPRPPVVVTARSLGAGQIGAIISATGSGNLLREIRVGTIRNATVEIDGQAASSGLSIALTGTTSTDVTITRARPGEDVLVPLIVVDTCGEWPTLVGAGPSVL